MTIQCTHLDVIMKSVKCTILGLVGCRHFSITVLKSDKSDLNMNHKSTKLIFSFFSRCEFLKVLHDFFCLSIWTKYKILRYFCFSFVKQWIWIYVSIFSHYFRSHSYLFISFVRKKTLITSVISRFLEEPLTRLPQLDGKIVEYPNFFLIGKNTLQKNFNETGRLSWRDILIVKKSFSESF